MFSTFVLLNFQTLIVNHFQNGILVGFLKKGLKNFMKFVIYTPHYGKDVTSSEVIDFDKNKCNHWYQTIGKKLMSYQRATKSNSIYPCHMFISLL